MSFSCEDCEIMCVTTSICSVEEDIRADVIDEVMDIVKTKISEKEYSIETMVELTDLGVKILELKDSK